MTPFVNLHTQTYYSILDSTINPKKLFERAKELSQDSIAITEHGSLASAWECWKISKETGIKLIIGCEMYFVNDVEHDRNSKFRHVILIAKNSQGYKNLLTLNKKGFDNNEFPSKRVYSVIDWKLLEEHKEGLICLTACGNGIVSALLASKPDEAISTLLRLKSIFGDDLGLEVQPNNMDRNANLYNEKIDQRFINRKLINLGKEHDIKVVAACNAQYLTKEESTTHDVLLAIGGHQPIYSNFRLRYTVPDFYLKSGDEVKSFFARNYGDELANQLCENSVYFANKCEIPAWIDPKFSNPSGKELPEFPIKDELDYDEFIAYKKDHSQELDLYEEDGKFLKFRCNKSLDEFISKNNLDDTQIKVYKDRLLEEMDVLNYCGVNSYMLIVADYLDWCRKNQVPVGTGRGSSGCSLVAYLLKINDVDPIKYKLVFARFHNKLKSSYSDIDCDFSKEDRFRVLEYINQKYGEDNVAGISNLNTITPKVYVKDVCRAYELGGDKEKAVQLGNAIADCIPADMKSIDDAYAKLPVFAEYCKRYPQIMDNKDICKNPRAFSTHAAGIILGSRPLHEIVPVRRDKEGNKAVEYEKDSSEENGLVKMDILGLSTLDIIERTKRLIKDAGKEVPEIDTEAYDEKTYDLISAGKTFCVFQFGTSAGTIDLCKKIKPKCMEDLAAITALARPNCKEIREDFIKTKEGKRKAILMHPSLQNALGDTLGFSLFDESLLQLAKDVAGWDLGEADKLRKLTKEKGKNPKKAQLWKEEFVQGAIKNKINQIVAEKIWEDIVVPYSRYGFNKSHAVAYSMITFQTAYLKAHFPIEFLIANLMEEVKSNALDSAKNIEKIKKEIRENKVKILPPSINHSNMSYALKGKNLITGLDALKFVGDAAIDDILEKRPFTSFFDFMVRSNSSKVRANNIQALAAAGALDDFKLTRKQMFYYCADYRKRLQVWLKKHDPQTEKFEYPFPDQEEFSVQEKFALEMHYIGEGFVCRPFKAYNEFFADNHHTIEDIKKSEDRKYLTSMKVILRDIFEFKVKKEVSKFYGKSMGKLLIEDKFGNQCSCTVFPDRWEAIQEHVKTFNKKLKFEAGIALNFSGNVNVYEDEKGIIFDKLYKVQSAPLLPKDLKAKKITIKASKKSEKIDIEISTAKPINDQEDLFEQLEDGLVEDGLLDFNEE